MQVAPPKFVINASGAIWWPNLQPIQVVAQRTHQLALQLELSKMDTNSIVNKIIQVKDSIPWVRCASGNVHLKAPLKVFPI